MARSSQNGGFQVAPRDFAAAWASFRRTVAVRADDRPPREAVLDATATAAPLDVDVAGANRLEVLVDFAGGDAGCGVRFEQPVFER